MKTITAAVVLSAIAVAGSGWTHTAKAAKTFVIGYSQSNNAEPYRAQLNIQLAHYVKQYPDLKLLPITDAHQSNTLQVSQVQNFIAQHVDVLMVSPTEPGPLSAPVEQACAKHIPVIILDRSVNTNCYRSFIGGNNILIGRLAGREAVRLLPHGGNVVELRGLLSDQPQIDRDAGFRTVIARHPNIKIIANREAKWLKPLAIPIMQQWLSRFKKIDLVYAQNDPMALGAYVAAAGVGRAKQIKFTGIDGLAIPDGGIRAVQLHELAATFIYPTCALQAAQYAERIVHHEPVRHRLILGTTQVTPRNAARLYRKYHFGG
ncbi:MAG: substrate-binding domain-containing protein [Chloroflexota bacterium]